MTDPGPVPDNFDVETDFPYVAGPQDDLHELAARVGPAVHSLSRLLTDLERHELPRRQLRDRLLQLRDFLRGWGDQ